MDGIVKEGPDDLARCWWATSTATYSKYHDEEWGYPTKDDRWLFEKICLEGFQAGLSWLTILNKRENIRRAFDNFEINRVSRFDDAKIEKLVKDAGIIRHRGKIASTINNAKRALELQDEFGSLAAFVWQYEPTADSRPLNMDREALSKISKTVESTALSKDLKRRGWSFVGPTTMYAFMQAAGIVNDQLDGCEARLRCSKLRAEFEIPKLK